MKQRLAWIDYAKVFSICLVVSFHIPPRFGGMGGELIRLLRMPAFFLIAGFLFNSNKFHSFKEFLLHRSRQLLVPYVAFFGIFYILWLLFGRSLSGDEAHWSTPLWQFISGQPEIIVATYWFIACLFSIQVIYFLLQKVLPKKGVFAVCVVLSLGSNCLDIPNIWNVASALAYLPFYAFSNCYKEYIHTVSFRTNPLSVMLLLVVAVAGIWMRNRCADDIFWGEQARHALFLVSGLCLLPPYISLCKMVGKAVGNRRWVEVIGRNTIVILALQNYCIGLLKLVFDRLSGTIGFLDNHAWLNPVLTVAIVIGLYPLLVLVERRVPWLAGRRSTTNVKSE